MIRSKRKSGSRRARFGVVAGVAATAMMAFGAASAQAVGVDQPFQATFDDAALNVGAQFDILDPPNTATIGDSTSTSTWNDTTHAINVPVGDFFFPSFTGDAFPGVPVTVDFSATDPIVGTLDPTTGVMTTTSSTYHATVHLLGAVCNYDLELAFKTDPGSPFNGDPWSVVTGNPTVITNGAIQDSWAAGENTADPDPDCNTINSLVTGAGGLVMGNGIDLTPATTTPPPAGAAPIAPAPKKKKCKKSKKRSASASKKSKCKKKK
jgi:hypothetical protein